MALASDRDWKDDLYPDEVESIGKHPAVDTLLYRLAWERHVHKIHYKRMKALLPPEPPLTVDEMDRVRARVTSLGLDQYKHQPCEHQWGPIEIRMGQPARRCSLCRCTSDARQDKLDWSATLPS